MTDVNPIQRTPLVATEPCWLEASGSRSCPRVARPRPPRRAHRASMPKGRAPHGDQGSHPQPQQASTHPPRGPARTVGHVMLEAKGGLRPAHLAAGRRHGPPPAGQEGPEEQPWHCPPGGCAKADANAHQTRISGSERDLVRDLTA